MQLPNTRKEKVEALLFLTEKKSWFLLLKKRIYCLILNRMKKIILSFILFISLFSSAQEHPFYEQFAFDFYGTTILDSIPVKKRIIVYENVFDFQILTHKFHSFLGSKQDKYEAIYAYRQKQHAFDSEFSTLKLDDLNKRKFKVRKKVKEKYPRLFITAPHIKNNIPDKVYLNIHVEESRFFNNIYYLELNNKGKVLNWRREYFEIIFTH